MDTGKVEEKIIALVHFSRKAGKLAIGYDAVRRSIEKGNTRLALIATDLEKGRQRSMRYLCDQTNVPLRSISTKKEIGEALNVRDVGVLGVEDINLAKGMKKYLDH